MSERAIETAEALAPTSLVSWAAVFAGALVAFAFAAMLDFLGLTVGAGSFNPFALAAGATAHGFTVGGGVWVSVVNLIALFIGAAIAARSARFSDLHRGMLHGLAVWGLAFFAALLIAGWFAGPGLAGPAPAPAAGTVQTSAAAAAPPGVGANAPGALLQSDGTYLQPDGTVTTASGTVIGHETPPAPPPASDGQGVATPSGAPAANASATNAAAATAPAATGAAQAAAPGGGAGVTAPLWAFIALLLGLVGALLGGRYGAGRHPWADRLAAREAVPPPPASPGAAPSPSEPLRF